MCVYKYIYMCVCVCIYIFIFLQILYLQILTILILSGSEFTALPGQYLTHTARTTWIAGNTACALATTPLLEDPARKHLYQVKTHMKTIYMMYWELQQIQANLVGLSL